MTFGSVVCALAYVLMLVLPITPDGRGLSLYVLCQIIAMLGGGIGNCLSWSLMADAIDYNEWKIWRARRRHYLCTALLLP